MNKGSVVLVGYENQENLGLRSLVASLHANRYEASLASFCPGNEREILQRIKDLSPAVVGFSLIFQYTLHEFRALSGYLRKHGIRSHFTAGGHFPSIEPELTFKMVPALDSIVLFEGEDTLVELLDQLHSPGEWASIRGLAFRCNGGIRINPTRPAIRDLDSLPLIFRNSSSFHEVAGVKTASMLASRGCLCDCSFCSIRQFYGSVEGSLRRTRSAVSVVAEMASLFRDEGVRYFLFQDDDFANRSPRQKRWIHEFLDELARQGLHKEVCWKISCRVDDLDPEMILRMKAHGLIAVYLGIESGNEEGLKKLNKGVTVAQNIQAIRVLKSSSIGLMTGFMMFDPSSTTTSLRENIEFLKETGRDGYYPVNFCKMLPYAGTPIAKELQETGRLGGSTIEPDYQFLDPLVDLYFYLVQKTFSFRNFDDKGNAAILVAARSEYDVIRAFYPSYPLAGYYRELIALIAASNLSAVATLGKLLDLVAVSETVSQQETEERVIHWVQEELGEELRITGELHRIRKKYLTDLGAVSL